MTTRAILMEEPKSAFRSRRSCSMARRPTMPPSSGNISPNPASSAASTRCGPARKSPARSRPTTSRAAYATPLPPENATLNPQPGDIVLSYVPPRMWGGNPNAIFDIGLFYGAGARMLFPIGWLAGSVVAQVPPDVRSILPAPAA